MQSSTLRVVRHRPRLLTLASHKSPVYDLPMQAPEMRSHLRLVLTGIAIVIGLAIAHEYLILAHLPPPVYVPVSAVVASIFAFGAMHRPKYFLVIVIALWAVLPRVSDSSAHDLFNACYVDAWILGAVAGKVIRKFSPRLSSVPNTDQPAPIER
jgi:hypothetical protein